MLRLLRAPLPRAHDLIAEFATNSREAAFLGEPGVNRRHVLVIGNNLCQPVPKSLLLDSFEIGPVELKARTTKSY